MAPATGGANGGATFRYDAERVFQIENSLLHHQMPNVQYRSQASSYTHVELASNTKMTARQ